jgi:hypothetical protein
LRIFSAANERPALENIDQSQKRKGILRRVSVSIFKIVNNFKEANKKLLIVKGSEKLYLLKGLENYQRIHRKY